MSMTTAYISPEDKKLISEKITEVYEKAKKLFPGKLNNWMRPGWNTNLKGTVAGQAFLNENQIKINPVLFNRNKKQFFKDTIPHEVAHLVAYKVFRDCGHGDGWKHTMIRLGYVPKRCHNYETDDLKRKVTITRYLYTCSCRTTYELTTQMHKKHLATKQRGFRCSQCRGFLTSLNQKKQTIQ